MTFAIHAMFLWQGFIEKDQCCDDVGGGQIEAAHGIVKWASAIEAAMLDLWERKDFAGVFDYEVTEAFGKYLREHHDYGLHRLALGLLLHIDQFFSQGEDRLTIEELVKAHDAILAVVQQ
ncbi:hypothetical protein HOR55_gp40 [Ralstonia phage RS-PII-1]|uniref:Uncharacterized protein n=1 Tax=Ralstonia phage RS-PII-1 TaxID=1932892 RepID=A0A1L7DQC2_9CAUD|nr:hypothetical protein HOR55_gp40 [Ralstonia phage RS-PII-1]APU00327.1 hypothetical protein [Ralstonia phage RS-PII-1]